jgi:hypothetical protein
MMIAAVSIVCATVLASVCIACFVWTEHLRLLRVKGDLHDRYFEFERSTLTRFQRHDLKLQNLEKRANDADDAETRVR